MLILGSSIFCLLKGGLHVEKHPAIFVTHALKEACTSSAKSVNSRFAKCLAGACSKGD